MYVRSRPDNNFLTDDLDLGIWRGGSSWPYLYATFVYRSWSCRSKFMVIGEKSSLSTKSECEIGTRSHQEMR